MSMIDKTIVSIRFSGWDLDPADIGKQLGFTQSELFESTVKRLKNGHVVWGVRLENDEPLEDKIETLLAQFTDDIRRWKTATEKVEVDIFCGLFLDRWNQGFNLTPNMLKKLSERNLIIGFDIYAPTESWTNQ